MSSSFPSRPLIFEAEQTTLLAQVPGRDDAKAEGWRVAHARRPRQHGRQERAFFPVPASCFLIPSICADPICRPQKKLAPMLESFFVRYVVPEFKSPHGFLRSRACDLVEKYEAVDMTWADQAVRFYSGRTCQLDPEADSRRRPFIPHTGAREHAELADELHHGPGFARPDPGCRRPARTRPVRAHPRAHAAEPRSHPPG